MIQDRKAACILVAISVFVTGCASTTGLERAEQMTTTMETVEDDINRTLDDIDAIETTLEELIRPGQRDISAVFERYTGHVENLENNGYELISSSQNMNNQAENYFSGWERENQNYENTRLQEIGERRRTEVQSRYEEIESVSSGLESTLESYISQNRDIQSFLSNDLTADGVESVTPVVEEVLEESYILRDELTAMQDGLVNTRADMSRRGRF